MPKQGGNPSACRELVELEVRDVIPLVEAQTHAVVLTTSDGQMVLPIFVDESAAVAIAFRLAHMQPPQPLSQDLLGSVVTQLGARVVEVRIDDLRDDIYTGRVFLEQGKRKVTLDARPSDSIAMALDGKARILVTRKVLDEAGISREEIDSLQKGGPGVGGSGEPDMDMEPPEDPHHGAMPPPGLAPKLTPNKTDEISL
ncbi:bifunctional nuclease family protein [Archangium sp.]|uniref:bifunctional nuclease family protein n=1 Tax=Archangium sp. TaxID=1872627 RepID=UPI00389A6DD5